MVNCVDRGDCSVQSKVWYSHEEQHVAPFKVRAFCPAAGSALAVTALPELWGRSPHLAREELHLGCAVGQCLLPVLPGLGNKNDRRIR